MESNRNPYEQTPQQPSAPQNADAQAGYGSSAPQPAMEQSAAQPGYAQPENAAQAGYYRYAAP